MALITRLTSLPSKQRQQDECGDVSLSLLVVQIGLVTTATSVPLLATKSFGCRLGLIGGSICGLEAAPPTAGVFDG